MQTNFLHQVNNINFCTLETLNINDYSFSMHLMCHTVVQRQTFNITEVSKVEVTVSKVV